MVYFLCIYTLQIHIICVKKVYLSYNINTMGTPELREKWKKSITKVDERFLRMVEALYQSYIQDENEAYNDLPEIAKQLIDQGLEDIKEGRIHSHEDVMSEFRKKYNLA